MKGGKGCMGRLWSDTVQSLGFHAKLIQADEGKKMLEASLKDLQKLVISQGKPKTLNARC